MVPVSSSSRDSSWAFQAWQRKQGEQWLPMNRTGPTDIYNAPILLKVEDK